mgnify:CR=1 FL=1
MTTEADPLGYVAGRHATENEAAERRVLARRGWAGEKHRRCQHPPSLGKSSVPSTPPPD